MRGGRGLRKAGTGGKWAGCDATWRWLDTTGLADGWDVRERG